MLENELHGRLELCERILRQTQWTLRVRWLMHLAVTIRVAVSEEVHTPHAEARSAQGVPPTDAIEAVCNRQPGRKCGSVYIENDRRWFCLPVSRRKLANEEAQAWHRARYQEMLLTFGQERYRLRHV